MNKVLIGLVASLAATVAQAQTTPVPLTNANFEANPIGALNLGSDGGYLGVLSWQKMLDMRH